MTASAVQVRWTGTRSSLTCPKGDSAMISLYGRSWWLKVPPPALHFSLRKSWTTARTALAQGTPAFPEAVISEDGYGAIGGDLFVEAG